MSIDIIEARSMTRLEAKQFKAANMDPRHKAKEMKKMRDEEDYEGILNISEDMEDWILEHVYPKLPDDYPQSEASKLANKTFNMTFNIPEDDEKNSVKSTPGIQQEEQITA